MKILFLGRIDINKKNGGDKIQMLAYSKILEKNNFYIDFFYNSNKNSHYNLIHLFNFDRFLDLYYQIIQFNHLKSILIIHTIHQKFEFINSNNFFLALKLKFILRYFICFKKVDKYFFKTIFKSNRKIINYFLSKANRYHFLSVEEKKWFESDYNIEIPDYKIIIFGNGVDYFNYKNLNNEKIRDIDCFLPSRIEPQKSTNELLKSLAKFKNLNIVLAGSINYYHFKYFIDFLTIIKKNKNIKFLGKIPNKEVLKLMNKTKIVVLPSLSEVYPLTEIEALSNGCIVISTKNTASDIELIYNLKDRIYRLEPINFENWAFIILKAIEEYSPKFIKIFSWDEVVNVLIEEYRNLGVYIDKK